MAPVEIRYGDLLDQPDVDVIVNPWNRNFIPWWLLLPAGVSGAIKRRGGYAPFKELRRFGLLAAGDAVMTSAGKLPFRAIIHVAALSAFWTSSEEIIARCVSNALAVASSHGFSSIAFPLIGSGTGRVREEVAMKTILHAAAQQAFDGHVIVVRYSAPQSNQRSQG
jgi:O-acetyl-ADP-ribose deacetylase